ncbi:MAG TPA: hypothetical protein PKU96_01455 [bacterium]|nr:hypothetical protein [Myxococcales bacterium]OQA58697.1 MAG: hypothetical protein BWY40_01414 [bacterium ADurb.Bin270]HPW45018.1 hypothetical protein [bacterium]HQH80875.1 hypothetical protein [bacterium]
MLRPLTFPQAATKIANFSGAGFYPPTTLGLGYVPADSNMGIFDKGHGFTTNCQRHKNFHFLYRKIVDAKTDNPLITTARQRFSEAGIKMTDIGVADADSFTKDRSLAQTIREVTSLDESARFDTLKERMILTGDECDGKTAVLSALLMANYDMRHYPTFGNYIFYMDQGYPVIVALRTTKIGQNDSHASYLTRLAEAELEEAFRCIERDLPAIKEGRNLLLRHIMGSLLHYEARFESEDIRLERAWQAVKYFLNS